MHLAKAVVVTDSRGVGDYIRGGHNGMLCKPFSTEDLAQAIDRLLEGPPRSAGLEETITNLGLRTALRPKYDPIWPKY